MNLDFNQRAHWHNKGSEVERLDPTFLDIERVIAKLNELVEAVNGLRDERDGITEPNQCLACANVGHPRCVCVTVAASGPCPCPRCGGLVTQPNTSYGYSGRFCTCGNLNQSVS